MIGIIYTGETMRELDKEIETLCDYEHDDIRIFVEPKFEEAFFQKFGDDSMRLDLEDIDFNPVYCGIEITSTERELKIKEHEAKKIVTLSINDIAEKYGVSADKIRIKE